MGVRAGTQDEVPLVAAGGGGSAPLPGRSTLRNPREQKNRLYSQGCQLDGLEGKNKIEKTFFLSLLILTAFQQLLPLFVLTQRQQQNPFGG